MTFFSKIVPRQRPGVAPTPYDLHRHLWDLFPAAPTASRDFLFHTVAGAEGLAIYLMSERRPMLDHPRWVVIGTKEYAPRLRPGQTLGFTLRANPTRMVKTADGRRLRVDVVMHAKWTARAESATDRARTTSDGVMQAATAWLHRKEALLGCRFLPDTLRVDAYRQRVMRRKGGTVTFATADFHGRLTVGEPERFLSGVRAGVGRAKAFGCGLLLLCASVQP